jgi:hypothetical protein
MKAMAYPETLETPNDGLSDLALSGFGIPEVP